LSSEQHIASSPLDIIQDKSWYGWLVCLSLTLDCGFHQHPSLSSQCLKWPWTMGYTCCSLLDWIVNGQILPSMIGDIWGAGKNAKEDVKSIVHFLKGGKCRQGRFLTARGRRINPQKEDGSQFQRRTYTSQHTPGGQMVPRLGSPPYVWKCLLCG
jgi:hypothetical protein